MTDQATTLMLQRRLKELQRASENPQVNTVSELDPNTESYSNEVREEMILFGQHHGFLDASGNLLMGFVWRYTVPMGAN